jgi:hypothetical protein
MVGCRVSAGIAADGLNLATVSERIAHSPHTHGGGYLLAAIRGKDHTAALCWGSITQQVTCCRNLP